MQKFGLVLLLVLPTLSFANNVHFANVSFTSQDSITGYAIGYTGVFDEKYALSLGHADASKGEISITSTAAGFNYGFQSFNTGSVYFGLGVARLDGLTMNIKTPYYELSIDSGGTSGLARLGYAKLSGEGLDYDLSLVTMDGESHVNAVMRGAIDNSDWGWLFGVSSNGDEAAVSAGVSLTF